MDKYDIAQILNEMAELMELQGENIYKVRAYHKAARTISELHEDIDIIVKEGRLQSLPGIGKFFSKKIEALVTTGYLPEYEKLKQSGLIFKKSTKKKIPSTRLLWWRAEKISEMLLYKLSRLKEVERIEIAGSLRRKLETVGNLNFVVAALNPQIVIDWLSHQSFLSQILLQEEDRLKILIKQGIEVELNFVPLDQFAFFLLYFTGSKEHNLKLAEISKKKNVSLIKLSSEKKIYHSLELPYIPPELREDMGEFEAKKMPNLVEDKDIRGIFHCHTTDSDGRNTIDEMADAAIDLGWEYIGISDHSKGSYQANGMDEIRLLKQIEYIRNLKKKIPIFAGIESDILIDGELDYSNDILKNLDFVIVSIHRRYKLNEKMMTKRLIKAIENPHTTMIGHLTGRLLLSREPCPLNIPKVIDAAIANNKIIELNAYPNRLDMDWRYWHEALNKGLRCCINPDAHNIKELQNVRFGVNIARKGWLEKKDILNTWPLKKVKKFLNVS